MSQRRAKTSAASNSGSYADKGNSDPEVSLTGEPDIELYTSEDGSGSLPVRFEGETAWATQAQMADLFGVDVRTVNEHLGHALGEGEISEEATIRIFRIVRREGAREVTRSLKHYARDAIISIGYRVHSPQGVHFRKWATGVLRERILDQHAAGVRRMRRLDNVTDLLATSRNEQLAAIGRIMQRYTGDMDRLADYDRGSLIALEETQSTVALDISDVEGIVEELRDRYPDDVRLGLMKDDSVHAVLGQIEQTFMGVPLYGSAEEKPRTCCTWSSRTTRSMTGTSAAPPRCSHTTSTGTTSSWTVRSPGTCSPRSPSLPRPATLRRKGNGVPYPQPARAAALGDHRV